eukprot:672465-Pleurochrysis_carterae.AAC.1
MGAPLEARDDRLVDVRWASGAVDAGRRKEFGEFGTEEFASVIAVQRADYLALSARALVE